MEFLPQFLDFPVEFLSQFLDFPVEFLSQLLDFPADFLSYGSDFQSQISQVLTKFFPLRTKHHPHGNHYADPRADGGNDDRESFIHRHAFVPFAEPLFTYAADLLVTDSRNPSINPSTRAIRSLSACWPSRSSLISSRISFRRELSIVQVAMPTLTPVLMVAAMSARISYNDMRSFHPRGRFSPTQPTFW